MAQTQHPPMTEHTQPLPKRFDVGTVVWFFGLALTVSHERVPGWLGIEPVWQWFPYGGVGTGALVVAIACYCLPSTNKPGLYAPKDRQRKRATWMASLLASVAGFAVVLVPSAVA